jgi:hypothetical protein
VPRPQAGARRQVRFDSLFISLPDLSCPLSHKDKEGRVRGTRWLIATISLNLAACVGRRDMRVSALEWALEEAQEQLSASDSRALSERDANQQDQARLREEIEGLRGDVDELERRERALGERGAYLEEALQRSIAANNAGTGDR